VIVDGQPYVVDCGYGTLRALVQAGIRPAEVASIWLTHLHNDHTTDVAAILSHQMTGGRPPSTTVFGPFGTADLVKGAIAFFKGDVEIRIVDEGRSVRPDSLFKGRDLEASATPIEVYRDERVTVKAVENTHYPERAKARMPVPLARVSLRHRHAIDRVLGRHGAVGRARGAGPQRGPVSCARRWTWRSTRGWPSRRGRRSPPATRTAWRATWPKRTPPPRTWGRWPPKAKVKTVVLSHLLPGGNNDLPETAYIDAVREYFNRPGRSSAEMVCASRPVWYPAGNDVLTVGAAFACLGVPCSTSCPTDGREHAR
jgi:hypothetical protein